MRWKMALLMLVVLENVFFQASIAETKFEKTATSNKDSRQFVKMPEQSLQFMRQDMLDHLAALSAIQGLLAEGKLAEAGDVAEKRMGRSSMGKHRGTGMGPGRFMPLEMRNTGWAMHNAASEFAQMAKQGDVKQAYKSLTNVTAQCVACHYSYRTR